MSEPAQKPAWIERKENVTLIYRGIWIVCAVLATADFFYHKHIVYKIEGFPAFYGLYGFICFFGIVIAGKYLRKLVARKEDYYDH